MKTHEIVVELAKIYDATCMRLCKICAHGICSQHQSAAGILAAMGFLYPPVGTPREPEGCCRAAVDSEGNRHDHEEWKRLLDEASCIIIEAMAALGSEHPVFWILDDFDGSGDSLKRLQDLRKELQTSKDQIRELKAQLQEQAEG